MLSLVSYQTFKSIKDKIADKNMVNDLNYEGIEFPVYGNDFGKIKKKNYFCINVFCYENNLFYPVYVSNEKFKISHSMSILKTNRFMCNKTRCKNKKHFCKYCLQCFSSERFLVEHKKTCLKINGKQTVKPRQGSIKFKNYFKQLALPFKLHAGFDYLLKGVRSSDRNNKTSYTEKYQAYIPCSFAYKVACVDDTFGKPVVLYIGKMKLIDSVNQFLKK